MEEENSVIGIGADNTDKLDAEEKFSIYHNKEEAKDEIDNSVKELTDFVDSITQDVSDLSQEEIERGISKILERAYPAKETAKPSKKAKHKKITLRVLFVAALLSAAFISCICVVGSSHNISMENGFVTFAKDAVKIVFFGEDKEEFIDVKTLTEDLKAHGFEDILLPRKLCDYKATTPVYSKGVSDGSSNDRVLFELNNGSILYSFKIEKIGNNVLPEGYFNVVDNFETITINGTNIYVFEFQNGVTCINYASEGYKYSIQSEIPLPEMMNTAETII